MDEWCKWQPFTSATCARAPTYQGNYEIALVDEFWRYKKGRSRTIYIGKVYKPTRTIRGRLREHLRATLGGQGNQKIAAFLDLGYRLKVRWRYHFEPSDGECELSEMRMLRGAAVQNAALGLGLAARQQLARLYEGAKVEGPQVRAHAIHQLLRVVSPTRAASPRAAPSPRRAERCSRAASAAATCLARSTISRHGSGPSPRVCVTIPQHVHHRQPREAADPC